MSLLKHAEKGVRYTWADFLAFGVEKGSEFPKGDERRECKYRVVFRGNRVVHQNWEVAFFQNSGSAPSTMEAGEACDALGSIQYHDVEQAYAEQAYVQADLLGNTTWVALPEEAWPSGWKGNWRRPVVVLEKALYGRPDSGAFWAKHCDRSLRRKATNLSLIGHGVMSTNVPSCCSRFTWATLNLLCRRLTLVKDGG
jgi:hypothetical protein